MKLQTSYRTDTCGNLRAEDAGKTVTIAGFLQNVRDKGVIMFITLRDFYGVTQAVTEDNAIKETIRGLNRESAISITGKVVERTDKNPKMPTGDIEIIPEKVTVLGKCEEILPFEIQNSRETNDDLRLTYRYLDLRNEKVKNNIILRADVIAFLRKQMVEQGFLEIQTPILTSSSPEGARDFIIPSRLHPGKFYALPQAPQQFKQLLMASGFDKYFQIAPCFRDEDARADRSPGEFYQLDMEMAFASQEDVFTVAERTLYNTFKEFADGEISPPPFTRITYADALNKYGSDKPDLRNPLLVADFTETFSASSFAAFNGKVIKGIIVNGGKAPTRKELDALTEKLKREGAGGLYYAKIENGLLSGGISKFISEDEKAALKSARLDFGYIFFVAEEKALAVKMSGLLRNELGVLFAVTKQEGYKFCWVVDFPMFEKNEETGALEFLHNPFSMPQTPIDEIDSVDPINLLAYQYDIVCNGIELSSGAVRNHSPEIMRKMFAIAGYGEDVLNSKFPALYNAFKFGAPPHAGIAPGVDRIVMMIAKEPSIKEIVAFPMNKNAKDLLMNAPNEVSEQQLREVSIQIRKNSNDAEL
ncbi:aspartate--tRNA(Asp/Asn) ligase [Clostridia bacterium]|nr:aspartate--tRNA(Asp/Asn) ligase [Clostridia bacterium]